MMVLRIFGIFVFLVLQSFKDVFAAALPHHALDSDCESLQAFVQFCYRLGRLQQNRCTLIQDRNYE